MPVSPMPPGPFARVYVALRRDLAGATLAPGTRVRVDETARLHGVSPTPVREALSRLAGERLVRGSRRDGYFVPHYSAADLQQLYDLAEMHLRAAISARRRFVASMAAFQCHEAGERDRFDPVRLLSQLLADAAQPVLLDAGLLALERLAPARPAESRLFDTGRESERIAQAAVEGGSGGLARAIRSYFRARQTKAAQIAAVMGSGAVEDTGYVPDIG